MGTVNRDPIRLLNRVSTGTSYVRLGDLIQDRDQKHEAMLDLLVEKGTITEDEAADLRVTPLADIVLQPANYI